jgi:cytochrome c oxidase cbb3-type subunit 3
LAAFAAIAVSAGDALAASAQMNYQTYCWQCHGMSGNGKGVNTPNMSIQPRDHSDAKGMKGIPDAQLFKAIKEGGLAISKSGLMPAWGATLSDDEIKALVQHLRKLCNCKEGT